MSYEYEPEKKKIPWLKLLPLIIGVGVGITLAVLGINPMDYITPWEVVLYILIFFLSTLACIVVHEIGHLLCGLVSGYSFSFLRVGPYTLCKYVEQVERDLEEEMKSEKTKKEEEKQKKETVSSEEESDEEEDDEDYEPPEPKKYQWKKHKIIGLSGQCLMIPPEDVHFDEVPFKFHLYGGGLMNLMSIPIVFISMIPFTGLMTSSPEAFRAMGISSCIFCFVSFISGVANLLPIQIGGMPTDGYTAKLCKNDPESHRAFVDSLQIAHESRRGVSMAEMPQALFYGKFSLSEKMTSNYLIAQIWHCTAYRFLMQGDTFQAKVIFEAIGNCEELIVPLRITGMYNFLYTMLLEARVEQVKIYDIPFSIIKQEKKMEPHTLSLCRYRFGHAKIVSDNTRNRNQSMSNFQRTAETSPFSGEVMDERVLLSRLEEVELHYGLWGV